jgi:cytochrome b6-f complex iron-sulfur subunit
MSDRAEAPRSSSRRWFLQGAVAGGAALIVAACSRGKSNSRQSSATTTSTAATKVGGPYPAKVDVGTVDHIRASVAAAGKPRYFAQARGYVGEYPAEFANAAQGVYPPEVLPVLAAGLVVLHQQCPHLGCRVPFCESSQYFECPCHTARFSRVGEYRAGPAPRGMALMGATITDGRLVVDPATTYPGLSIGTDTTNQKPAGPYCVG